MDSIKQNGDDPVAMVRPIRPSLSDSDLLQINVSNVNKKIKQSTRICGGVKIIKLDDNDHHNYQNSTSDGGDEEEGKIFGQQENDQDGKIVKPKFAVMPFGTYLATTMTMMSNDNKNCGSETKSTNTISSTQMAVPDKTRPKKSFGLIKDKGIFTTLFDCWITRTDSVIDLSLSSKNNQKKKVDKKKKKKQAISLNNLQDDNNDGEQNEPNHRRTSTPRNAEFNTNADDSVEDISLRQNNDRNNIVLSSGAVSSTSTFNHFVSQSEISILHPNTPCSSRSPVLQSDSSSSPPPDVDFAFSNGHLHQIQISPSSSSASSNVPVGPSSNEDDYQPTDGDASPPHLYEPYPMPSESLPSARDIKSTPIFHTQIDYINRLVPDLLAISNCSFYWGKMDRYEAERLLDGKPEGTFLLRDSAQEDHLFSVSFRRFDRSLHARIENREHRFSFDSHDPGVFSSPTVTGLIEHYKVPSHCMFFEPVLTKPLNRTFTFTLQHLARVTICDHVSYDTINQLPLPAMMKSYLKEYHYRIKVRTRHFDESLNRFIQICTVHFSQNAHNQPPAAPKSK